jgi:transcriptional regulator with XRE-family HTH domain
MSKSPCDLMREARKRLDKTQSQIADELGLPQPLISRWETGDAFPRTEDVRRVAKAYGLKPEQLLPRDEAKAS